MDEIDLIVSTLKYNKPYRAFCAEYEEWVRIVTGFNARLQVKYRFFDTKAFLDAVGV